MSAPATEVVSKKPAEVLKELVDGVADFKKSLETVQTDIADLKTKAAATPHNPNYSTAGFIGATPSDNATYSVLKMAAYARGWVGPDEVKYELDCHEKMTKAYHDAGWRGQTAVANLARRVLVPFGTKLIPPMSSECDRMVGELKHKMIARADKVDQDEARWLQKKLGRMVTKDLGTISDTAGGVLVGFPTLGELVDLQRNIEVFANAGASEQALPANGRLQLPKLTGPTTAYWVGEAASITESTSNTGYLDLQAKKLGIRVDLNNELVRFGSITAEAMIRTDMAKVAALKMDLAQLEGTGGTQIKGLITYDSASTWSTGNDKLLAYTVTSNTIQISDAADMEALLPDTAGEPTAWVMRRDLWAKLRNRRASSVSSADSAGQFLANVIRSVSDKIPLEWDGTKVVRSTQVSNTRDGAKTYVILGHFPDWITARFGALEFLSTMVSDQAFQNDQTQIRCIQHVDAGPRHASSFVFADAVTIQ